MTPRRRWAWAIIAITPAVAVAQNTMAVSPDGRWVAYTARDTLRIADTRTSGPPIVVGAVKSYYSVPRWSKSGDRVAYYSNASGSGQLWAWDASTRRSVKLSNVDGGISPHPGGRFSGYIGDPLRYDWSPDGSTIVFAHQVALDVGASKAGTTIRPPSPESLAAGRPLVLTTTTPRDWTMQGVLRAHSGYTIRGGERALVIDTVFRPRTVTQLFLLDVAAGRVRQLTSDTSEYFTPVWSPDGRRIAFMTTEGRPVTGFGPEESNIYVLEIATGRRTRVTSGRMQKTLPRWSPDGRWIAYQGRLQTGRKGQGVYVVPADGGAPPRWMTEKLDRATSYFEWAPTGSAIMAVHRDGLYTRIASIDLASAMPTRASGADATVDALATNAGGIAWIETTDPNDATRLMFRAADGSPGRRIADVEPPADPRTSRRQIALTWRNSRGEEIEGVLVYPRAYAAGRRYPLILDAYSSGSNTRRNDMAMRLMPGTFFFRPNHRAPHMWVNPMKSEKYDTVEPSAAGIRIMADDILSGIDTLVRRGLVDDARMCIVGFSNGGLQGEQLLTQTTRFKCAVLQSPSTSNWLTAFLLTTDDHSAPHFLHDVLPWQDPALYTAMIPIFQADKITTPVLLAVGDLESSTTIATIEMFNALRWLKRDVTLLRYANQGHGFTGAAQTDFESRVKAFFERYLER